MNRLSGKRRTEIIKLLLDGSSARAASRTMGVSVNTVSKLLTDTGSAALEFQRRALRNLPGRHVQIIRIWRSLGGSASRASQPDRTGCLRGVWTLTAICADTKVVPCWHVGECDSTNTASFLVDLSSRFTGPIQQVWSDQKPHLQVAEAASGSESSDAGLPESGARVAARCAGSSYRPPRQIGPQAPAAHKASEFNLPCGAWVDLQGRAPRQWTLGSNQLADSSSKMNEKYLHAVSLHLMFYHFGRIHEAAACR